MSVEGSNGIGEERDGGCSEFWPRALSGSGGDPPCVVREGSRFESSRIVELAASWEKADMYALELTQEVVDITKDSGTDRSVWPNRRRGVSRSQKFVRLADANGRPIVAEV